MENEQKLEAQANLIHANPILPVNIGDEVVFWTSMEGDPETVSDADLYGNAYYDDINSGVILTENNPGELGSVYWTRSYDPTKNIHMRATISAGYGSGADGITLFMFCDSGSTSSSDSTGGLAIYLDEYNDNTVSLYNNGSIVGDPIYTGFNLDDGSLRTAEVIYEPLNNSDYECYVTLYLNGAFVFRYLTEFTSSNQYFGVSAYCGSSDNFHYVTHVEMKSANPWLATNGYKV